MPFFQPTELLDLSEDERLIPSLLRAPKLDLKPLPENLKYIYLGENETIPVVINAQLSVEEERHVPEVLNKNKEVIGWTNENLKGINSLIREHQIPHEDHAEPCRDPQRKLNQAMEDELMREILKLLDRGNNYPAPYSQWVSSILMVPKKSDASIVEDVWGTLVTTTKKDHYPRHFIDKMLKRLAGFHKRFMKKLAKIAQYMTCLVQNREGGALSESKPSTSTEGGTSRAHNYNQGATQEATWKEVVMVTLKDEINWTPRSKITLGNFITYLAKSMRILDEEKTSMVSIPEELLDLGRLLMKMEIKTSESEVIIFLYPEDKEILVDVAMTTAMSSEITTR